jgi:hypothetical protein
MQQHQQRTLDSLRRVQDFLDTHTDTVGVLAMSEGRKQLDAAVSALATHTDGQGSLTLQMSGQSSQQTSLAADLRKAHMAPVAKFARAKLRSAPDFAALTKSGLHLQPRTLIRAARAMATAAAPYANAFTDAGFPPDTIPQLGAAASALETAMVDRQNANVSRVLATKGIQQELNKGREAVAMLNAVVSRQLVSNFTVLAAWRVAHRITAKQGALRIVGGTATPAAAATTTSSTSTVAEEVKPAA